MIRKTIYRYKQRTGELMSMDSVTLNSKETKWYMNKYGIQGVELSRDYKRTSVKSVRGNVVTEIEFTWVNSLETL